MAGGGIILAGGLNTRMGTNKAFLEINQTSFIERIINELKQVVEEIIVVTNNPDAYSHISAKVVTDIIPQKGPLSGIHAGLTASLHRYNLVVACDMPFINHNLARFMLGRSEGYDVLVPQFGDYLEPLYAVYSKNCLEPIEDCLKKGARKVIAFYPQVRVRYLGADVINKLVKDQKVFFNVNTPKDLTLAKEIAGEEGNEG